MSNPESISSPTKNGDPSLFVESLHGAEDRLPSLASFRIEHGKMLKLHRKRGNDREVLDKIAQLISKGQATGALLASEDDRWAAQSLLDYWSSLLYRAGYEAPDANLLDFDPSLSLDLSTTRNKLFNLKDRLFKNADKKNRKKIDIYRVSGLCLVGLLSLVAIITFPNHFNKQSKESPTTQQQSDSNFKAEELQIKINDLNENLAQEISQSGKYKTIVEHLDRSENLKLPDGQRFGVFKFSSLSNQEWRKFTSIEKLHLTSVQYSPDGKNILTIGDDKTARLWNIQGRLLLVIGKEKSTYNAVFSPDLKLIAIIGTDGKITLSDYQGKEKNTLNKNQPLTSELVFSPDGKLIATISLDKTIRLWSIEGTLISSRKYQSKVTSLKFSPDGKSILTANADGVVHIWDFSSQHPNVKILTTKD